MAVTPQQFFSKNMKWIVLVLFILFMVKSVQSCNRNMTITQLDTEITHLNDSLSTMYGTEKETLLLQLRGCEGDKAQLEYEVKLLKAAKESADRRAAAAESNNKSAMEMAGKIKTNTTIEVTGVEQVIDSTEVKK